MMIYMESCNWGTSYKFTLGLNVIPWYHFMCLVFHVVCLHPILLFVVRLLPNSMVEFSHLI
jgi:hypothetical protein